jgi:phage tail-like protein
MAEYYPPIGCFFKLGINGLSTTAQDYAFQEAVGLSAEITFEEIAEGGENNFKYKLPTAKKYSNVVLKRGLVTKTSGLANWCSQTIDSDFATKINTYDLMLMLMNAQGQVLFTWNFFSAWPVKWIISDLKSAQSEVVIETLEFAYNSFKVKSNAN